MVDVMVTRLYLLWNEVKLNFTLGFCPPDLYAFVIGSYVIWTGLAGARYCVDLIKTRRTRVLLNQLWKWCGIIFKSSVLLSIWVRIFVDCTSIKLHVKSVFWWYEQSLLLLQIFVIPVLIGLLFELLVIVPMRVPVDESPVFLLYQDWALGLIFLKIWTRMVRIYIHPFHFLSHRKIK